MLLSQFRQAQTDFGHDAEAQSIIKGHRTKHSFKNCMMKVAARVGESSQWTLIGDVIPKRSAITSQPTTLRPRYW